MVRPIRFALKVLVAADMKGAEVRLDTLNLAQFEKALRTALGQ